MAPDDSMPSTDPALWEPPTVFLAGGITGVEDRQVQAAEALTELGVIVLNPRRRHFPVDDPGQTPAVRGATQRFALHPGTGPPSSPGGLRGRGSVYEGRECWAGTGGFGFTL